MPTDDEYLGGFSEAGVSAEEGAPCLLKCKVVREGKGVKKAKFYQSIR